MFAGRIVNAARDLADYGVYGVTVGNQSEPDVLRQRTSYDVEVCRRSCPGAHRSRRATRLTERVRDPSRRRWSVASARSCRARTTSRAARTSSPRCCGSSDQLLQNAIISLDISLGFTDPASSTRRSAPAPMPRGRNGVNDPWRAYIEVAPRAVAASECATGPPPSRGRQREAGVRNTSRTGAERARTSYARSMLPRHAALRAIATRPPRSRPTRRPTGVAAEIEIERPVCDEPDA